MYGEKLQVHNDKLREVLATLRMHNFKLQPEKCAFLRKEITYLGHKLTTRGLLPDSDKIAVVKKFLLPQTLATSNNIWVYAGNIGSSFRILVKLLNL